MIQPDIEFGSKFKFDAEKYIAVRSQPNKANMNVINIKGRCLTFLKTAITEVECRLPATRNLFKGLSYIHPNRILSQT